MKNISIKLDSVSKKFPLHKQKPTLVESFFPKNRYRQFWALKDINISIGKGERIGIIGPNGTGKTTLLKIIAGITRPTSGQVTTQGKIVSIIDVSAGFQPELSGIENILLNGLIIGMTKQDVTLRQKQIISYADIGQFIHAPLYTYSQGMKLRLGFSIAVHSEPDILLLDENIVVGDQDFQSKSFKTMKRLFSQGKTIVVVTHSMKFIKNNTDKVIWLHKGKIQKIGPSKNVIAMYNKSTKQ